jgi:hypothetical protein
MTGCFLYVILTAHYIKYGEEFVQLLGYGITINPKKRSKQYSDHTGIEQEFSMLYFGTLLEIKALESIIKQRIASKCHKIYGEPVEWVSPKAKMTEIDIIKLINDTIDQEGFNTRPLKDEFLPFNNLEHQRTITVKELNSNPDKYLEVIA